jgi:exopolysaccharide biosynthesis WecB/TagA/CpsF family protein
VSAPHILLVQLADIGDLVLSLPAIAALRAALPSARLTLLTTRHAAPIMEGTGWVDTLLTFDKHAFDSPSALIRPANARAALHLASTLRRLHADAVVVLHHFSTRAGGLKFRVLLSAAGARVTVGLSSRFAPPLSHPVPDDGFGGRHQAEYWLSLIERTCAALGHRDAPRAPGHPILHPVEPPPLPPKGDRPRIAIHAGSGGYSTARRWEPERFAAVADHLHATRAAEIVLVGGRDDDTPALRAALSTPAIDLSGRTTLGELASALRTCDLFIGADSGVMHIAAAVGVPVVALFGPSNADAWRPWGVSGRVIVVRAGVRCSPCAYVGTGVGARSGCPARTCMRLITPDAVIAAAEHLLDGLPVPVPSPAPPPERSPMRVLGMPVSRITYDEWMTQIAAWMNEDSPRHVCTINPEMIMTARRDAVFRVVLERADLTVPDGVGLLLAARWQGEPLRERVTGSDGVPRIAAEAARHGWRIFLLGAGEGVAARAADMLRAAHPGVSIVGTFSGSPRPEDEDALVERVRASDAHILLVAFGAPEQDKWIARNLHRLGVKMAMGVGGTFDFIAGVVPRAPLAWRQLGIEWLYRLIRQPWRIRRMARLPLFAVLAWMEARRKDGGGA